MTELEMDQGHKIIVQRNQLAKARSILTEAFIAAGVSGQHAVDCERAAFVVKNRFLPGNHPAWKSAPECSCWVGRAAEFLKS